MGAVNTFRQWLGSFITPKSSNDKTIPFNNGRFSNHFNNSANLEGSLFNTILEVSSSKELETDLVNTRSEARRLFRNNAIFQSIVEIYVSNVVGEGLRPSITIRTDGDTGDREAEVEMAFDSWSQKRNSLDGQANFALSQAKAYMEMLVSGECFVRLYRQRGKLSYELYESEQVPLGQSLLIDGHSYPLGIRFNRLGAPQSYFFRHRDDGNRTAGLESTLDEFNVIEVPSAVGRGRIPNVVHCFDRRSLRVNHKRGFPPFSVVIKLLDDLNRYVNGEIKSMELANFYSIVLKSEANVSNSNTNNFVNEPLQSGKIVQLDPSIAGVEVLDTKGKGLHFKEFTEQILHQIAMGVKLPYEELARSFNASYSASRAALLAAWRQYTSKRTVIAQEFCQPIFEAWYVNEYKEPLPDNYHVVWRGSTMPAIDPEKEISARKMALDCFLTNRSKIMEDMGAGTFESNLTRLKREQEMIKREGLEIDEDNSNEEGRTPRPQRNSQ